MEKGARTLLVDDTPMVLPMSPLPTSKENIRALRKWAQKCSALPSSNVPTVNGRSQFSLGSPTPLVTSNVDSPHASFRLSVVCVRSVFPAMVFIRNVAGESVRIRIEI